MDRDTDEMSEPQQRNHALTAALIGGAAAATAGACVAARAWSRRQQDGQPRNAVMATALTATECAEHAKGKGSVTASEPATTNEGTAMPANEPTSRSEPKVPREPVL